MGYIIAISLNLEYVYLFTLVSVIDFYLGLHDD